MSLEVKDISFSYGKRQILDHVSFQVPKGKVLALLGPNGIGKTTLLKSFSGIMNPSAGKTILNGINVLDLSLAERGRLIAYVPQSTNNLFPISVVDTVIMGRQPFMRFKSSEKDKQIVFDILERMDLTSFAFRDIDQLSGGERQRVFIARALAQEPELLLLDEPTSSMDIKNQLYTMNLISNLVKEKNIIAVVSIHDLNLASMFCDYFLFLKDGKVFSFGEDKQVLTKENLYDVYHVNTDINEIEGYSHIRLLKNLPK